MGTGILRKHLAPTASGSSPSAAVVETYKEQTEVMRRDTRMLRLSLSFLALAVLLTFFARYIEATFVYGFAAICALAAFASIMRWIQMVPAEHSGRLVRWLRTLREYVANEPPAPVGQSNDAKKEQQSQPVTYAG